MTQPPYGPQNPDPSYPAPAQPTYSPGPGYGSGYGPAYGAGGRSGEARGFDPGYGSAGVAPAPAEDGEGKRRSRRGIAIGATVAGALVIGGAGYAVASFLSGGGPQPEDVLPSDTIAFVKLDLDPAAGQKTAAMSLLEKFPALGDGVDDVREDLVGQLLEVSDADLSYQQDVEPWLGDRMAVAAVPDAESDGGVAPVLVLAVDDQQAMGDTLREVRDRLGVGFAVRDDFLLVAQDQETADRIAAEESRLSEDGRYAGDLDALGGDQIAVAWADLSAAQNLFGAALGEAAGGLATQPLSGRVILGVHADDDALELVGMDFSVSDVGPGPRPTEPTELIQNLPDGTLGAVSVSGAGETVVRAYEQFAEGGTLAEMEQQLASLGLDLPDDLRAVLGTDLVVAVFGDVENPGFGARVATDDPERAIEVIDRLANEPEFGLPVRPEPVEGGYLLTSNPYVGQTLTADGGLGDTDAFQAAVPAAEDATAVGFANLATIIEQIPESDGFRRDDYAALDAVGFSSTPTDEGSRFVLRITTR